MSTATTTTTKPFTPRLVWDWTDQFDFTQGEMELAARERQDMADQMADLDTRSAELDRRDATYAQWMESTITH